MIEMDKKYDHRKVEDKWYKFWEEKGYFRAEPRPGKKKFAISMPPPNVTGKIHMGHVLNNTLQDILIRMKRMQGYETLWQPGIDHAGIATQNVVERELAKEGKTRFDLGREEFIKRVWKWKEKYGNTILLQLRKLGVSADWTRTKFTMDPDMYDAVIEAFVRLYERGLIYKGTRIINWCPRCGTALADDEVEYEEEHSHLWYIKYPLVDGDGYIVVATTRPETYLGDTAVAVNPNDDRYKHLIGKKVRLPLIDWTRKSFSLEGEGTDVSPEIPVIADELVDPEFGTGAVKVTPAHDPNDYEIAERHHLQHVVVLDLEAKMNENAGPYRGLDRYEARKRIVEDLKNAGFLEKIENYSHSVGHCYRCHTVIEPYLSEQWFVKMKPLAEPAIKAVKEGKIKIIPENWKKVYFHWLENVKDWCISRQIWWGHRIPVFYCKDCGEMTVAKEKPEKCPHCGSPHLNQDEDVLDTWFSSWLWPFSTLGWPQKTPYLDYFYPNDVLISGWDILFFWVARMVMAGYAFMGKEPFEYIYLNGLIRDEKRRKLSKSLGNSPDPLELFEKFGADGVRMGLMLIAPEGQDIIYSDKRLEVGRNFANKIWNATRLLFLHMDENYSWNGLPEKLEIEDRWILTKTNETVEKVTRGLDGFDFNGVAWTLYEFFWGEFCDWYLEMIKPRLNDPEKKDAALSVAFYVLDRFLKLLHPYMPFITEEIWQKLPNREGESIMIAPWPEKDEHSYPLSLDYVEQLKGVIEGLREIRAEFKLPGDTKLTLQALVPEAETFYPILEEKLPVLKLLARVEKIEKVTEAPGKAATIHTHGMTFFVPLGDIIDIEKERHRISKEVSALKIQIDKLVKKLTNKSFLEKAPGEIVEKEKEKLERFKAKLEKLEERLKNL